jgi:hypothetical protein
LQHHESFAQSLFRHSGLDPESRNQSVALDTGLCQYDNGIGLIGLCKGLIASILIRKENP